MSKNKRDGGQNKGEFEERLSQIMGFEEKKEFCALCALPYSPPAMLYLTVFPK